MGALDGISAPEFKRWIGAALNAMAMLTDEQNIALARSLGFFLTEVK